ncbi:MAG: hypothetical protein HYX24_00100 [Candidatus Aenigmarchaeota archaeon]|nr:hypothetical protein [Candidatus Aenigmarchaeota archaeon]
MDHKDLEEFISKHGIEARVVGFSSSTQTVEQAELQLGIAKGRIAKSVLFIVKKSSRPLLVNEVEKHTGYRVGGVPPICHASVIDTVVDAEVFRHDMVWCGGGDERHLLGIRPKDIERFQKARVMEVCL